MKNSSKHHRLILCAALPMEVQVLCEKLQVSLPSRTNPMVSFTTSENISGFILVSGVGHERMNNLLPRVPTGPVLSWISVGFAGALVSGLRVGDVLNGTTVITPKGELILSAHSSTVEYRDEGRILCCANQLVTTPGEKQILYLRSGAVAVDMESAAVARYAQERRESFIWIRIISDHLDESLPKPLFQCFDSHGFPDSVAVVRQICIHPSLIPVFLRLWKRSQFLSKRLAEAILPIM